MLQAGLWNGLASAPSIALAEAPTAAPLCVLAPSSTTCAPATACYHPAAPCAYLAQQRETCLPKVLAEHIHRTLAVHIRAGKELTWPSWVSCGSFSSGVLLSLVPEEESWSSDTFTCLLASVWPADVLQIQGQGKACERQVQWAPNSMYCKALQHHTGRTSHEFKRDLMSPVASSVRRHGIPRQHRNAWAEQGGIPLMSCLSFCFCSECGSSGFLPSGAFGLSLLPVSSFFSPFAPSSFLLSASPPLSFLAPFEGSFSPELPF